MREWLTKRELFTKYRFAVATDGPWDMQNFLNLQCSLSQLDYPRWARKWIDIRKMFSNYLGVRRCGILKMLGYYGYEFEGSQHCGLDDAKNIARILLRLATDGCEIKINSHLKKCLTRLEQPINKANNKKTATSRPSSAESDAESLEFPED